MAFPGETILRSEGWRKDMAAIRAIIAEKEIMGIVIGLPVMMDGSSGIQAEKVHAFTAKLRGSVRVPIYYQDERLTTREADRLLMQADRNRQERKRVVDSVAACLILQAFIDSRIEYVEEEAEPSAD
jgi:putative holliday junction resolvase